MAGSVAPVADTFIIDAYNLIRRMLSPAEAAFGSEASRHVLETRIRAFRNACGPGTRIFLVYDGELGMPAPARREKGFEVYFSRPPRKADDVVLELALKHEGERGVHVVTSDFTDIGNRLHGLRVKHLTSQEFAELYSRRIQPVGGTKNTAQELGEETKPEKISSGEVDAWLKAFGFSGDRGEEPGP